MIKGVVVQLQGFLAKFSGGTDSTFKEALRVRVIDSPDDYGDDHKAWINAQLAEACMKHQIPDKQTLVVGMTNFLDYDW